MPITLICPNIVNSNGHFRCKRGHEHLLRNHVLTVDDDESDLMLEEFSGQLFSLEDYKEDLKHDSFA